MKPNLAKLTIARQIAAIALAQWREVRPDETRDGKVRRAGVGEGRVEGGAHDHGPDEADAKSGYRAI